MSDAKDRLRALDRVPAPDVWERARGTEPAPERDDVVVGPGASKRIVAGIVAFALFLGAGVFAWQAFRPGTTAPVAVSNDGVSGVALWPERTAEALAVVQARADAGDPAVAWRLDPKEVATRFAIEILGWGRPEGSYAVTLDLSWGPGDPFVTATIARFALPCPSPPPGQPMTCPPPYDSETLTLERLATQGAPGVWSVTSAVAGDLRLDLARGDTIANGTQVDGSIRFPATAASVPTFTAETGFHVGTTAGCDQTRGGNVQEGDSTLFRVSVDPTTCQETSPAGYAWIETGTGVILSGAVKDPLRYGGNDLAPRFFGLSLVPFTVALPATSEETPTPTPTPTSTSQATITSTGSIEGGTLECTVSFPSSTLTPGEPTGATFTVRNVTGHTVDIAQGINGMIGTLVYSTDMRELQDSARRHDGIMGPAPTEQPLAPGDHTTILALDTPVLWPGPLEITPRCGNDELPTLTVDVASPGAPPDTATAIANAVGALGDRFADCSPVASGEWVTGAVATGSTSTSRNARCAALVIEHPGFDVVVLAWVAPPDAPAVDLAELPSKIQAVPPFDFPDGTTISLSWWVTVAAVDHVSCAGHSSVSIGPNSSGYSGGGGTCNP
ncbi:MAG: hypothetical protein ACXVWF_01450 [Actinomycetota bacterium]